MLTLATRSASVKQGGPAARRPIVVAMSSEPVPSPGGEALVPEGRWTVDAARSSVAFEVRHLGVSRVRGTFGSFECRLDGGDRPRIDGVVDVASLATGDAVRDERLLSAEFFDVAEHPAIAFAAGRAIPHAGGWRIEGELTIRGVTRPLALAASRADRDDGAVGITARGTLSRKDFGLVWDALVEAGRLVVADRVAALLDVVLAPDGRA